MQETNSLQTLLDRVAVGDLVQRERMARDNRSWDEMAGYYHPDSVVEVSWFRGTGPEFVARSRSTAREDSVSIHVMSPSVVTVVGDRAIAETPCTLRGFSRHDGVDVSVECFVRLLTRASRCDGSWLIAGLRCLYVRDRMMACNPAQRLHLDEELLRTFRPSYRYIAYYLAQRGLTPSDDLPGVDRPETVTRLRAAERRWLETGLCA